MGETATTRDRNRALADELRAVLGDDGVLTGEALAERPRSFWDSSPLNAKALVRPRTTEELSRIMALCHAANQPVVTHGGLTGCVGGQAVADDEVVVSLEHMTAIEDIDPVGRTITVQAGAVLQNVQEAVARENLFYPLDLGARGSCTIGGNIATNAGGINVLRYGMMREQVLGLEAVLADGTVLSSMNSMMKNNSGYDLKQLFIGSEGTLGIVTRAVVKLEEATVTRSTAMVALENFDAVARLLQHMGKQLAGSLSAFEVMWGDYFRAVTEPGWHRPPMERGHPFYVVAEAVGADPRNDAARFEDCLEQAMNDGLIADAVISKSETERNALWAVREDFEAVVQPQPTFLYDVSLPIRDMDTYIREVMAHLRRLWPDGQCHVIGHIADGNLHLFVSPGTGDESLHAASDEAVYGPLARCGGSVSAEHGIGIDKKRWLTTSRSETEVELMRALKRTLDPLNLLNRGKVFDA